MIRPDSNNIYSFSVEIINVRMIFHDPSSHMHARTFFLRVACSQEHMFTIEIFRKFSGCDKNGRRRSLSLNPFEPIANAISAPSG
jgi:hypothetical protein